MTGLTGPVLGWLGAGGVFLVLELMTGSGWLLWPAGSAALTAVLLLATPLDMVAQALVFAVLSIGSTLLGRRWLKGRAVSAHEIKDRDEALIGESARAVGAFRDGEGRVFAGGAEWSASLAEAAEVADGARVKVVAVKGARLIVKA